MNNHLPFELAFELSDVDFESLSKKEKLNYINWCLGRLKANYWISEEFDYKCYLTKEMNEVEKIKKYIQRSFK